MLAPKPRELRLSVPLKEIDAIVAARLGVTRICGNEQPAAFNRQIAMYLANHVGGWSTTQIGRFYNGRDHSTVCYAVKRIAALRETDPDVDVLLSNLTQEIRSVPIRLRAWRVRERDSTQMVPRRHMLDEDVLDALADRLAEKLKQRGI